MPCVVIGNIKGEPGDDGRPGNDAVGIASITQTGTNGKHHYYRITLTNNTHFDFTVTDGEDGIVDLTTDTPTQVLNKLKNVDGTGSGLDADLLDGHDSSYFATGDELEALSNVIHNQLHSTWHLYKNMQVVSLHIVDWTLNDPTRNAYFPARTLQIPVGFRPPQTVYIDDVTVASQHIVIGADGVINIFAPEGSPGVFHGQACWVTQE